MRLGRSSKQHNNPLVDVECMLVETGRFLTISTGNLALQYEAPVAQAAANRTPIEPWPIGIIKLRIERLVPWLALHRLCAPDCQAVGEW